MAKIGDLVRFLNSVGGGRIVKIDGNIAYVDEDGFETPVLIKECVVVSSAPEAPAKKVVVVEQGIAPTKIQDQINSSPRIIVSQPEKETEPPYQETAEGENLNVVLAFEASDLKRLSSCTYDAYLVNDSNYQLMYTFLTKGNEQDGWTCRGAGSVEPGMQVWVCEVLREELPSMDRVAVQYLAYKPDREFKLKTVACVEHKLDTTKFFKLHCFLRNPYFDEPVIALNIVRNDMPQRQIEIDVPAMEQALKEKRKAPKPVSKPAQRKALSEPLVIDLHINELVDTTAGLSNSDMLNLQIDKFREIMDANLRNHGMKIVFIHGKGEGVLRKALLKELAYRYKEHEVQDASFREYGFGATQVKIK